MGKSKNDKKVNKRVKQLNKQIREDVFGDRFWIKQIQKSKVEGINYYLYELRDRIQPERNQIVNCGWLTDFAITTFNDLAIEMNNFIVNSNFWTEYRKVN